MRSFPGIFLFLFSFFASAQSQQNPCAAYQLTPESPHTGPRQFNVIQVDYAHASSFVLISDGSGRKIGTASDGSRVAKIPHAFYEDGDEVMAATGLGPEQEPEEITIQYPQTGQYEILAVSRTGKPQWLRISVYNCGKRWNKEIEVPAGKPGVTSRWHFSYQPSADHEPELVADKPSQEAGSTRFSSCSHR